MNSRPAAVPSAVSPTADPVAARVRARLMRTRAGRVLRRFALILLFSALMVVLLVQTRDNQTYHRLQATSARVADEYQKAFDARGALLPLLLADKVPPELAPRLAGFQFNPLYPILAVSRPEVGVCCSARPVTLYLSADGRMVVTFDGRRFRSQWLTEEQFNQRREALGFDRGVGQP